MNRHDKPIGIFDSGVGGLTVFKALRKKLPKENLVYFGDTAHLPYGTKSPQAVTRFSGEIADFLVSEEHIKLLVVACNTASSHALTALQSRLDVPVVGVIDPSAEAGLRATRNKEVGVIGTEGTVASHAYRRALRRVDSSVKVHEVACPLFVPLVEEGRWNGSVVSEIARSYLRGLKATRMDTLILGCTHYPLLKTVLKRIVGDGVTLVDSSEAMSVKVQEVLEHLRLGRNKGKGTSRFYASDAPDRFKRLARRFLGVALKEVMIRKFT